MPPKRGAANNKALGLPNGGADLLHAAVLQVQRVDSHTRLSHAAADGLRRGGQEGGRREGGKADGLVWGGQEGREGGEVRLMAWCGGAGGGGKGGR